MLTPANDIASKAEEPPSEEFIQKLLSRVFQGTTPEVEADSIREFLTIPQELVSLWTTHHLDGTTSPGQLLMPNTGNGNVNKLIDNYLEMKDPTETENGWTLDVSEEPVDYIRESRIYFLILWIGYGSKELGRQALKVNFIKSLIIESMSKANKDKSVAREIQTAVGKLGSEAWNTLLQQLLISKIIKAAHTDIIPDGALQAVASHLRSRAQERISDEHPDMNPAFVEPFISGEVYRQQAAADEKTDAAIALLKRPEVIDEIIDKITAIAA